MLRRYAWLAGFLIAPAAAVDLKPETAEAFARYVARAEARIETDVDRGDGFLFAAAPELRATLRRGYVLTNPRTPRGGLRVKDGLIHHWAGAAFLPGSTVPRVLALVQDYERHKQYYRPDVVDAHILSHHGDDFKVSMRLLKKKSLVTVVLDTDHEIRYHRLSDTRWWSRSRTTRIVEVENAGSRSERRLPPDTGHGYLWRLNTYWTFQERDGGTYVECEAISLTRDIPRALRLLIAPIVRDLPVESLTNTLSRTKAAAAAGERK
jgi:hypothetical protein